MRSSADHERDCRFGFMERKTTWCKERQEIENRRREGKKTDPPGFYDNPENYDSKLKSHSVEVQYGYCQSSACPLCSSYR